MATTFAIATDYHVICCWNCSGHYAVTERAYSRFSDSGKNWFCPYCGESTVVVESELPGSRRRSGNLKTTTNGPTIGGRTLKKMPSVNGRPMPPTRGN